MDLPCGQCVGCRRRRQDDWAVRIVHEASLYQHNAYVTLTYREEDLPKTGSLEKRDFQLFMKRLRKQKGAGIRYFHAGEYGELFRPHYHSALFNVRFDDAEFLKKSKTGYPVYKSQVLEETWQKGYCSVQDLELGSARYIAKYTLKRVTGQRAENHYSRHNSETGEVWKVSPEYATMSTGRADNKGIGYGWFKKYGDQLYKDPVITFPGGKKFPVPRYYLKLMEAADPERFKRVSARLERLGQDHAEETYQRLQEIEAAKERVSAWRKQAY